MSAADQCADCGAKAEIYDNGVPLCLLCSDVRDAAAVLRHQAVFEDVRAARQEYRQAGDDLREAHRLLKDLDPANPDGTDALRKATARFAKAHQSYRRSVELMIQQARDMLKRTPPG